MEQVFASCEGCADLLHEVHCIAQTFPLGHRRPGDGRYSHERQGSAARTRPISGGPVSGRVRFLDVLISD